MGRGRRGNKVGGRGKKKEGERNSFNLGVNELDLAYTRGKERTEEEGKREEKLSNLLFSCFKLFNISKVDQVCLESHIMRISDLG